METVLILTFAALAIIFLVLWLISYSRDESYGQLTKEVRGINDTLNRLVYKLPTPQEASEKQGAAATEPEAEISKPITIESVRSALRYNGISPEILDTHEPDVIKFNFKDRKYRLNLGRLPYVNIMLVFGIDKEDDAELMKEAAQYVSLRSYGASVFVIPEDGCSLLVPTSMRIPISICAITFVSSWKWLRTPAGTSTAVTKNSRSKRKSPRRKPSIPPSSPPRTKWLAKKLRHKPDLYGTY